jgi:hypothetical protein
MEFRVSSAKITQKGRKKKIGYLGALGSMMVFA